MDCFILYYSSLLSINNLYMSIDKKQVPWLLIYVCRFYLPLSESETRVTTFISRLETIRYSDLWTDSSRIWLSKHKGIL